MLGAAAVVSGYIPLRQLGGASVGLLMPLLLSAFEWLGCSAEGGGVGGLG